MRQTEAESKPKGKEAIKEDEHFAPYEEVR